MKVYCIFDCDQWKTRSSFSLICVCDEGHLQDMLHAIQLDHDYTDEDMQTYICIEDMKLNAFE